jgi:predicted acyl esterase
MQIVDDSTNTCGFQAMVPMCDGTRLNTFVFLPGSVGPRWPVILHRTPYGITTADAPDKTDFTKAWLLRVPVERDHGFRWKMITQSGGT